MLYFSIEYNSSSPSIFLSSGRKRLRQRCRALQVLLAETRERSLRAAGLAKMLRKDLEVAAEFSLCEGPEVVLTRLQLTGHIRVLAPHSHNHFIFVPGVFGCMCTYLSLPSCDIKEKSYIFAFLSPHLLMTSLLLN